DQKSAPMGRTRKEDGATHATVPLLLRGCGDSLRQRWSSRRSRPQYGKSRSYDAEHFTNGCAKTVGPSPCAFASAAGEDTRGREVARHRSQLRTQGSQRRCKLRAFGRRKGSERVEIASPAAAADLSNAAAQALYLHQIQAAGADRESDDAQDRRHVSGVLAPAAPTSSAFFLPPVSASREAPRRLERRRRSLRALAQRRGCNDVHAIGCH